MNQELCMEVEGTTTNGQINKKSKADAETTPEAAWGGLDCNICLDLAAEPVVTLCGHLYCWHCIYKWLHTESSSIQNCPVCKASLSANSLVPLYGRGRNTRPAHRAFDVPPRPSQFRAQTNPDGTETVHRHVRQHHPHNDSEFTPSSPLIGATSRGLCGMAIAALPWMFGNQHQFGGTSSYYFSGINEGSLRTRRQVKEVERSLHQIWLFLSCSALLCLLFF